MIVRLSYSSSALNKLGRKQGFLFQQVHKPAWVKLEELLVLSGYKKQVEARERADISKPEMDYLHNKLGNFFLKNKP